MKKLIQLIYSKVELKAAIGTKFVTLEQVIREIS